MVFSTKELRLREEIALLEKRMSISDQESTPHKQASGLTRKSLSGQGSASPETWILKDFEPSNVSDVSLDLRVAEDVFVSDKVYGRINGADHLLRLEKQGKIRRLERNQDGTITLLPNNRGRNVYYVPSLETFKLPPELEIILDAKSTTGRVFAMCTDRSKDFVQEGNKSNVIMSVQPYVFPILITPGKTSLYQAIVRTEGTNYMTHQEIRNNKAGIRLFERETELDLQKKGMFGRDGLALRFDTSTVLASKKPGEIKDPIDMEARGVYEVTEYFDIIRGEDDFEISPDKGYLLGTIERIVLGNAVGIISRDNPETGTGLWGHFAGCIQPGFNGRITMECRSEVGRIIQKGDYAGFIMFDKMEEELGKTGGYQGAYSNQQQNVPQPPKMFKPLKT